LSLKMVCRNDDRYEGRSHFNFCTGRRTV
jgi:hypothetical protein